MFCIFFFFQAEDGIRDGTVTGVQTCALPICPGLRYNKTEPRLVEPDVYFRKVDDQWQVFLNEDDMPQLRLSPTYRRLLRSEERRVGKECRSRLSPYH